MKKYFTKEGIEKLKKSFHISKKKKEKKGDKW